MLRYLAALLDRDLRLLQRELRAYPDDASLWVRPEGLPNSGGTLALHLAGNLEHFIGSVLGATGYVRDRDAEFTTTGVSRAEVVQRVEAARVTVAAVLARLDEADLHREYPIPVAGVRLDTGDFLAHLAVHLGYHLGQLDYHRRAVTRLATAAGAMAISELASARPDT